MPWETRKPIETKVPIFVTVLDKKEFKGTLINEDALIIVVLLTVDCSNCLLIASSIVAYIRELNNDPRTRDLPVKEKIDMMNTGMPINFLLTVDSPEEREEKDKLDEEEKEKEKHTVLSDIRSSINVLNKR